MKTCRVGSPTITRRDEVAVKNQNGKRRRYSAKLNKCDKDFLEAEGFRMVKEEFSESGRLATPSTADVITELLVELRTLRRQTAEHNQAAEQCTCGACKIISPVHPGATDRS